MTDFTINPTKCVFVVLATAMSAFVISPALAASPYDLPPQSTTSSDGIVASFLPRKTLLSDIKSVKLIHECRQYITHLKGTMLHASPSSNFPTDDIGDSSPFSSYRPNSNHEKEHGTNLMDILHNVQSTRRFQSALTNEKLPINPNVVIPNVEFPVFSTAHQNDPLSDSDKNTLQIMEHMCLKYAFDKLLQTQLKEEYLAGKKSLKYENDILNNDFLQNPDRTLPEFENDGSLSHYKHHESHPVFLEFKDAFHFPTPLASKHKYYDIIQNALKRASSQTELLSGLFGSIINNNGVQSDDLKSLSDNKVNQYQDTAMIAPSKRSGFWSWLRQARAKRRHRLSINNQMLTLANSVFQENQQRLQSNKNKMRHHMFLQG